MIAFKTACLALALSAVAGAAAAQQGQGTPLTPEQINAEAYTNSVIQNYHPDPSSFFDQPPPLRTDTARDCVERQAKDATAPKVVRTMPAPGSVVRPGQMVLSVTFDQPMACRANTANGSPFPVPCPGDRAAVLVAPDQRTLTTVCDVEAGAQAYGRQLSDLFREAGWTVTWNAVFGSGPAATGLSAALGDTAQDQAVRDAFTAAGVRLGPRPAAPGIVQTPELFVGAPH